MTSAALAHIVAGRGRFAADLADFVRFASVGADPRRRGDVVACARWLADRLRRAGLQDAALARTAGHPIVYAVLARRGGRPDGARLRPLRRPAGRAVARLAHAALRARARWRQPRRPRRLRRQGPGALPRRGDRQPPRDERPPARERALRLRGRGGARQPASARVPAMPPAAPRARRRDRLGHPHARAGLAGDRRGHARRGLVRDRAVAAPAPSCTPASSAARSPTRWRRCARCSRSSTTRDGRITVPGLLRPRAPDRGGERARIARVAPGAAELLADAVRRGRRARPASAPSSARRAPPSAHRHRRRRRLRRAGHTDRDPRPGARTAEPAARPRAGPRGRATGSSARACAR